MGIALTALFTTLSWSGLHSPLTLCPSVSGGIVPWNLRPQDAPRLWMTGRQPPTDARPSLLTRGSRQRGALASEQPRRRDPGKGARAGGNILPSDSAR